MGVFLAGGGAQVWYIFWVTIFVVISCGENWGIEVLSSPGERNSPTSETGWWGGMPGNRAEFTDRRPALWMGFPDRAENGVPGERYLGLFWGIKTGA